jgi:hypothetical protein
MKKMDANIDIAALVTGAIGAVVGAVGATFKSGKAWQRVEDKMEMHTVKMDHFNEKVDLICDELARRLTVLENRVQFDGYYVKRVEPVRSSNERNGP